MKKTTNIFLVSVVIFFKIFGLLPFSLVEWNKSKFLVHISRSKISVIYNLILTITMIYTSGFNGLPQLIESYKNNNEKDLRGIMDIISCSTGVLTCMIWIIFAFNHEKMEKTAREFMEIDSFIQKLQNIEQLKFRIWPLIIRTCMLVIFWLVLISCEWITPQQPINWFIWIFLYIITTTPLLMIPLQYGLIMHLICFRLKLLNTAIARIGTKTILPRYQTVTVQNISDDDVTIKKLQSIKYAYETLYNLTIVISNFYSFPILLIMGNACFLTLYIVYDTIINFILESSNLEITFAIVNALWLVVTTAPIIILISTLETLTKEYKRTPIEILKLIPHFNDCRRLLYEAEWFLHGFLHKPMEFTAFGFFKLDNTFLKSLLGTTITYLIIVLQFRPSHVKENQ